MSELRILDPNNGDLYNQFFSEIHGQKPRVIITGVFTAFEHSVRKAALREGQLPTVAIKSRELQKYIGTGSERLEGLFRRKCRALIPGTVELLPVVEESYDVDSWAIRRGLLATGVYHPQLLNKKYSVIELDALTNEGRFGQGDNYDSLARFLASGPPPDDGITLPPDDRTKSIARFAKRAILGDQLDQVNTSPFQIDTYNTTEL